MEVIVALFFAFIFSFIGSIPPGTLNLIAIQLGLNDRINIAWRFSVAASLVEYPYAWIAVKFEKLVTSSPLIISNINLIASVVMICLGLLNIFSNERPTRLSKKFADSGFRRGIVLGILNPLAIPYWLGITAYLKSQNWVLLDSAFELHAYLFGVTLGALVVLMLLAYLARKVVAQFVTNKWVKKAPGIILLTLGVYALLRYIIHN